MGVNRGSGSWELQWHPAHGGRVRRVLLSRARRRRLAAAAALACVVLLALLATLPFGARTLFRRVQMEGLARENAELHVAGTEMVGRFGDLVAATETALARGRRLAWAVGAPPVVWEPGVPPAPGPEATSTELTAWLEAGAVALERLTEGLAAARPQSPCPVEGLPTVPPVALERAVVVTRFGWRVSPFTGQREAHHGVAVAAALGEPVVAPGGGRVVFSGSVRERRSNEWTRLGTTVVIEHGGSVYSVMGGLGDVTVRRGDRVVRGARLGAVGQTAWTRVPALYFEIRWPVAGGSRPIDPGLVNVGFPVADLDARLREPFAGLPDDYARLDHLPGGGR